MKIFPSLDKIVLNKNRLADYVRDCVLSVLNGERGLQSESYDTVSIIIETSSHLPDKKNSSEEIIIRLEFDSEGQLTDKLKEITFVDGTFG